MERGGREGRGREEETEEEIIADRIRQELQSWEGVTVHDHRFGGIEFRVNGREMGHMHGGRLADLPFPKDVGRKLINEGRASPHHFIPQSGWISYHITGGLEDVPKVTELFRLQYDRMTSYGRQKQRPQ